MSLVWTRILEWIFAAVIVVGNGLVIFLIATKRKLRTTTNWFVLSLAVADFGIGAISPSIPQKTLPNYTLEAIWLVFIHASMTNLCALTLDRYLAIVKPLRYVPFMTKTRVILLIFAAWGIISPSLTCHFLEYDMGVFICHTIIAVFVSVFLFFTTARIFLLARKHSRQNAAVVKQLSFNHTLHCKVPEPQEAAAAKTICIVVFIFLSYAVQHIYYMFCARAKLCSPSETLIISNSLLALMNSLANPIVYFLFKREIRKEILQLFCTKNLSCQQSI